MKTIYLECNMGAAGDMIMAALLELHEAPDAFLERLNAVGIPKVTVSRETAVKCGITGTHIRVRIDGKEEHHHHGHNHEHHEHEHHHEHNSYKGIEHTISHLNISQTVKENTLAVYKLIAEAESHAHNVPVNQIHFHEVGEMDAVADIVGVCMLMEELAPDVVLASHVNVGSGHVHCSHGILPVPAPATVHIMQGVPIYSDETKGELCTPTGAAILKHFVREFTNLPAIAINSIGYGIGTKDFKKANCVRAFMGDCSGSAETVTELVCNLDDMTPEAVAFAQRFLLEEGALDVYTSPIGMKKGRQGVSLFCMCLIDDRDKMINLIFKHTSTLGMREYTSRRYALKKEHHELQSQYGKVKAKTSKGYGVSKTKAESDDIEKIAREQGISMQDVLNSIEIRKV